MELLLKVNPGIYWLAGAILTDVFSTFYSAKANGLEDVKSQIVAGILCGSVVANINITYDGGSSKVFNRALNAP